uniref:Uncharacterized protein n=1 Tax=Arundo donax TaxID=35708 RepID=A0A0A9DXU2_ARUDO
MDPEDDCTGKRGVECSGDTSKHRRGGIHNRQCHVHVPGKGEILVARGGKLSAPSSSMDQIEHGRVESKAETGAADKEGIDQALMDLRSAASLKGRCYGRRIPWRWRASLQREEACQEACDFAGESSMNGPGRMAGVGRWPRLGFLGRGGRRIRGGDQCSLDAVLI